VNDEADDALTVEGEESSPHAKEIEAPRAPAACYRRELEHEHRDTTDESRREGRE
jgi:hypothetical protein